MANSDCLSPLSRGPPGGPAQAQPPGETRPAGSEARGQMPGVPWAPFPKTCPPAARASSPIQASQTRPHRNREPGGQRASPAVTCSPRSRRAQGLSSASPRPRSAPVSRPAGARSLWSAPLGASLPRPWPRPLRVLKSFRPHAGCDCERLLSMEPGPAERHGALGSSPCSGPRPPDPLVI